MNKSDDKVTDQSAFDLEAGVPSLPTSTPQIEGELRPKPKFADRISKRVIGVVIGFLATMMTIFFVSLDAMDNKKNAKPEEKKVVQATEESESKGVPKELIDPNEGEDVLTGGQRATLVKPEKPPVVTADTSPFPNPDNVRVPSIYDSGDSPRIPKDKSSDKNKIPTPQEQAENAARQAEMALLEQRRTRLAQAREDGLSVKAYNDDGEDKNSGRPDRATYTDDSSVAARARANIANNASITPVAYQGGQGQQGEQDEKLSFVSGAAKDDRSYHPHRAVPAISKNEIKTGSYIPLALNQGINSDLPGQITARVTEHVYDTISGCRLLIPAMSTVVGKYDSKVAMGQQRMLVVWNSVIFPDGQELNLAGMQGYDTGGYAGLESEVDNHFWRLFGLAFGMSMVTATVQISVPQSNGNGNAQTPSQQIATALAQQYGQLGAQILGKYMAVQPTLKNEPGERFLIMVPRTIVLDKVWRNRCEATGG